MTDSCRRSAGVDPAPLQEAVGALLGEIERWRGGESAEDDVAILAVELSAAVDQSEPVARNQTGGSL